MRLCRFTATVAALIFIGACQEAPTEPGTLADGLVPQTDVAGQAVVHFVSVGSPDVSGTGDPVAAFSLVALEKADGSVSGQWEDMWGGGSGIHVAVDCLKVVDNTAVVSGVITYSAGTETYTVGRHALAAVVDNGKSANDDPDQISRTWIGRCDNHDVSDFPLFDLVNGQVIVK